ncbi:MAG: SPOR domain-containing protein [Bacteroides sp.]|nr:SPOR domain-containing protein [Bacteroides sp.]MCM1476899.1 SPOR domain-containing protein [Bacteroides sp.]
MISIIQHIQYLIATQDCVLVPGLGAFVCRYVPAQIHDDGCLMTAPTRELGFNSALTHDDGSLIMSITRREGVSYECARGAVQQEVELIQRRLKNEGAVELARIGELTLTGHGTIDFHPAASNLIAQLPFAGLNSIELAPLEMAEVETPVILKVDTTAPRPSRGKTVAMSVLKYAASAAILIGACLTLLTPINPSGFNLASLQPQTPHVEEAAEFPVPDESRFANSKIILFQPDPAEATATVPAKPLTAVDTECVDRYYVIVASAKSLKEAKRYVKLHSKAGCPLRILPSDGRYRVYAASGNDFNEMSAFRTADARFAAQNPNAWVYTLK